MLTHSPAIAFDYVLTTLDNQNPTLQVQDPDVTFALLDLVRTSMKSTNIIQGDVIARSSTWTACLDAAKSFLTKVVSPVLEEGPICHFGEGSEEWQTSSCCDTTYGPKHISRSDIHYC